jgi:hypothetical protein
MVRCVAGGLPHGTICCPSVKLCVHSVRRGGRGAVACGNCGSDKFGAMTVKRQYANSGLEIAAISHTSRKFFHSGRVGGRRPVANSQ